MRKFTSENYVFGIEPQNTQLINRIVEVRKDFNQKLPDAIIAATAIENNCQLVSRDGGFKRVTNLQLCFIES
ncbi:MAG: hypothetical protein LDLANPLL_02828 [Turneriella sp.]|nr:hypothetical protein [Turneriella sp.]